VGTLKGLFRYNGINWTKVISLEDEKIHAVAFTGNGDVWVGLIEKGVRRIQPDGAHQDFNTSNSQLTNDNVRGLTVDENGRVWIATAGGGINIYDNRNWSFYRADSQGIQSDNVMALTQDRFGRIWAGTDKGTSYFDVSTGKWTLYTDLSTLAISFGKSTRERCSYQDDLIWIGTNGQGLLNSRLTPLTPIIKKYDISNLPDTVKAGDKLAPIIDVKLIDGYAMSIGDFVRSTETEEYTLYPHIAVDPDKLINKGQEFLFDFVDNPITAPRTPGKYNLIWRLWQCGRYVDPPLELEFTVVP
jgi:sugar lactone lactonase YvrE